MKILVAKTAGVSVVTQKQGRSAASQREPCMRAVGTAADILAMPGVMLTPESIALTCHGRQKSAGGLVWEYPGLHEELKNED